MSRHPHLNRLAAFTALALLAAAQPPHVHDIDFYGLHKITPSRVLRATKLHAGDPLPGSRGDLQDRVSEIPGVVAARVEAVCCEGPDVELFIGVEERGAPHVAFRSEPAGDAALPEDVTAAYRDFVSGAKRAGRNDTRAFQKQFADFAETHPDELRQVLRTAAEPEQRAAAAAILGYAPRKQSVVEDLEYALQDPDDSVRANALEALRALAALSVQQPALGLRVSPTWPIELLNSVVLSDRVQATDLLITLTDHADRAALDQIRARALPAIVEMARWEALRYALPPFLLVGRVAGLSDAETQRRWSSGEREPVIQKALGRSQRK